MNRKWILGCALALALVVPAEARAWMNFCNWTPGTVWVALTARRTCGFWGCGDTGCASAPRVLGWWALGANGCRTLLNGDMSYYSVLLYAEDSAGHVWSGWDPADARCTPWSRFDYCDASTFCDASSRMVIYRWIPNLDSDDFTVNLVL